MLLWSSTVYVYSDMDRWNVLSKNVFIICQHGVHHVYFYENALKCSNKNNGRNASFKPYYSIPLLEQSLPDYKCYLSLRIVIWFINNLYNETQPQ